MGNGTTDMGLAEKSKRHDAGFGDDGKEKSDGPGLRLHRDGQRKKISRRGIAVLSHSNGSIAHGWLIKDCPEMILRNVLVDPVVFCLWEGGEFDPWSYLSRSADAIPFATDVCYNFCYREPHNAIELLLHWFIASEIGIANSIQRVCRVHPHPLKRAVLIRVVSTAL